MQNINNQTSILDFTSALQAEGPWFESMCLHPYKTRQLQDWRVFSCSAKNL